VERSSVAGAAVEPPMGAPDGEDRAMPDVVSAQSGVPLRKHPVWESQITVIVALLIIPGLLFGAYAGGTDAYFRNIQAPSANGNWGSYNLTEGKPISIAGYSNANTEATQTVDINDTNLLNATITLSWTDEPDMKRPVRTYENQPDEFALSVTSPNGTTYDSPVTANVHGQEGKIIIDVNLDLKKPSKEANATFEVTINCGNCGSYYNRASLVGYTDPGNAWTLDVNYQYYARK
jgi:hypothetical protein